MDNPKYSSLRIRRHDSLPCPPSTCTLRKHTTSVLISSRRLGAASKNSPYVGSFRHAPPTTFRSMAASDTTTQHHSTAGTMSSMLLSPLFSTSNNATSSKNAYQHTMKNSPYVGWFRHAPPSKHSSKLQRKVNSRLLSSFERSYYSRNHDDRNKFLHKVDPDLLIQLDRWHQALTLFLLRENKQSIDCHRMMGKSHSMTCSDVCSRSPPFHEIINGRLVGGGNGNETRGLRFSQSSTVLTDPSTTSTAIKVLARLSTWLLFPLTCDDEDDVSLCDKSIGLKLAMNGTNYVDDHSGDHSSSDPEDDDDSDSDDDSTSTSDSVSMGDPTAQSPLSHPPLEIDADTEREFSDMNVSVSEIAEAYYAHRLIDQERENDPRGDTTNSLHNRSGLLATTYEEESPVGTPPSEHRLDYEITQMDIARMARNASRHLDVDSILNLPTVTYQSRRVLSRPQVCSPINEKSTREEGWSFVMVSGVKSSTTGESRSEIHIEEDVCVICLEAFRHGERLRVLPCDHSFHVGCIDRWLSGSHSHSECFTTGCPTCKKRPSGIRVKEEIPSESLIEVPGGNLEEEGHTLDGSVPSWAFAKLGSALAMSQGY